MIYKPIQIKSLELSFPHKVCFTDFNCQITYGTKIAMIGRNGSGKSSLIKAILGDDSIYKTGDWYTIKEKDIGYLDQHYYTLKSDKSVLETISELIPDWSHSQVRDHLNDFLFRKNDEVNAKVESLSGGEKARLCLAQIAAKTPSLLILDEISNNLDLETKEHVVQVLKSYPGAILIISHDSDFLKELSVDEVVNLNKLRC